MPPFICSNYKILIAGFGFIRSVSLSFFRTKLHETRTRQRLLASEIKDQKFGRDLTAGSIPQHPLNFSNPALVSNMFQSGYRVINMIGVGNIVSENSWGPPAGSFSIISVLTRIAAGPSMAAAVLVAQY